MRNGEITIVDCQVGNIMSVRNMLRRVGFESNVTSSAADIASASKLILPGVGAFDYGMEKLRALGLEDALQRRVIDDGVPVLGICLGMQFFARGSDEGNVRGLSWIDADVVRFDTARLDSHDRIPHMGWAHVDGARDAALFSTDDQERRFYFVHSYHLACDNEADVTAWATHGYRFAAAVERDNIVGVQFHPEKSHRHGMEVLRNFAERY